MSVESPAPTLHSSGSCLTTNACANGILSAAVHPSQLLRESHLGPPTQPASEPVRVVLSNCLPQLARDIEVGERALRAVPEFHGALMDGVAARVLRSGAPCPSRRALLRLPYLLRLQDCCRHRGHEGPQLRASAPGHRRVDSQPRILRESRQARAVGQTRTRTSPCSPPTRLRPH